MMNPLWYPGRREVKRITRVLESLAVEHRLHRAETEQDRLREQVRERGRKFLGGDGMEGVKNG